MNIKDKIKHYSTAIRLCNLLIAENGEARFVGGCVRDTILNKKIADIDIATTLFPEEVENILKKHNVNYFSIGKTFGTVTAVIDNQQFEITTLRKDLNCDGRYAQVQFTKDWKEDAERRDFTINALSCDLEGNVYDYFDGVNDLSAGIVKFIGDPEQRILEDHLRILRFFRFSAYYAKNIDSQSLVAIQKHVSHLKHVSGTRIRSELSKIFLAPNAIETLKLMNNQGVFQHIIHCDKTTINNLENLYKASKDFNYEINEILCFSILLRASSEIKKTINSFAFTRAEYSLLETLINSTISDWSEEGLKNAWQIYKNYFKEVVLVNIAITNVNLESNEVLHKLFNILLKESPISGKDLENLNIGQGKQMGKLLKIAEKLWYNHEFKISKKEILKELSRYVNEL